MIMTIANQLGQSADEDMPSESRSDQPVDGVSTPYCVKPLSWNNRSMTVKEEKKNDIALQLSGMTRVLFGPFQRH